ncbi:hypothetical protein Clacol_001867 [Clathrus columnatus]|uniref:Uncharacterized protein n=1 Tax=Clathrus columnatus TaxID=1419009 RepID=A0AAV5A2J7_9AGAM|nr:hypothetical protein Clacol_001867 [Clathrus columnatus]
MLIARFRIQQKWNLRLSKFSNAVLSQHRSQNNFFYKGYHHAHGLKSSTFKNLGVSETARKSRIASSSIRVAMNFQDAIKAKEIAYETLKDTYKTNPTSKLGRQTPSRLVAHSLVHSLLRKGQVMDAAYEMKYIMSLGVTFHHRTLQKNISLLCSIPFSGTANQTVTSNFIVDSVYPGDSESSFLLSALYSRLPPPTRLATSLLITGRRYRQKRTEEMFNRLIDACLLQGEIVIATLLFVLLVKDWQFRSVVRASGSRDEPLVCDTETQQRLSHLGFPSPSFGKTIALHRLKIPYPEPATLQRILSSIKDRMVFTNTPTEAHLDSIKSLALLASLVEEKSLPYGNISFLLRVIQDCPRGAVYHTMTIRHRGQLQSLPVYKYLHNVLSDICYGLPSQKPKQADIVNPCMLPCLDLRSYNTLLHYVLRHRRSPAMANQIIEHLISHRKPPLKPDIVTYNILLRSASLLGRNDIAFIILERLKQPLNSGISSVEIPKLTSLDKQPRRNIPKQIATQTLTVPFRDHTTSITPDTYTLSSYVIHLVLTDQLDIMMKTLLELFPILILPANRWQGDSSEFQLSLERAVSYGPYVLAAFLDGCQKAGKTGMMERLWFLAKEAEFDSWKQPLDLELMLLGAYRLRRTLQS